MKVYIEIVMLDNLVMTSSIAGMSYASLGIRVHKFRTAMAAMLGTIISLTYPFWKMATPLMIIAKLAVGCILGLILFAGLEKPLLGIVVFFVQTALVGGICIFANYLITGDVGDALTGVPVLPYAVPSCIAALTFFFVRSIIRIAKRKRTDAGYKFDVEMSLGGKTARLKGYLDTGNSLYDDCTSLPIVVVKLSSLDSAFGHAAVIGSIVGYKRIETVSGHGKIFLIRPDNFRLYSGEIMNKYSDVMLGVTELGFSRKEDMLLHPSVVGG